MSYSITNADGTQLVILADNTIDTTTTSLTLFGRNVSNYGLPIDQNFVYLLQNFANTVAPSNPLQGQIWYDKKLGGIRVYNSNSWNSIIPPFDGVTGTATVKIGPNNADVMVTIADNKIISVSAYSNIIPALLPDTVSINDVRYSFKQLFPKGIMPGITLASNSADFSFFGTATSANVLATARTINIIGDLTGSAAFDGSSNINIATTFSNLYIGNTNVTVAGTYSKIVVSDGGRVIGGGNIANSDVIDALGFVPYSGANVNVAAQGNTLVARDASGSFSANIMIGTATAAYALKTPVMIGVNGDVIGAASFDGSNSVTISTTLASVSNLIAGTYSTVKVDTKGRVISGSTTADTPVGAIIVFNNPVVIPVGWAKCNGQSYTVPDGSVVVTPNMSNITVGSSGFYIMKLY